MGYKINLSPAFHAALLCAEFIDDFWGLGDKWNTLAADAGATVAEDADGLKGTVILTTGAVDNNEAYLFTNEIYNWLTQTPLLIIGRFQYSEAATNAANVGFGIGSGLGAANSLLDNGGGPPANYHGAMWYKVDGGTRWQFESSVATAQITTDTEKTAGGAANQTLGIELSLLDSGEVQAIPWIDTLGGNNLIQPYANSPGMYPVPIAHRFAVPTNSEMALFFGVKAGSGSSEVVNVDLAMCGIRR